MDRLRELGKTFLIFAAGLVVLGIAAALLSLVLPGTVADRLLGKSAQTTELSTIDAPNFYDEIDALGEGNFNEHPLVIDFFARTADVTYTGPISIQYGDMVLIEIELPNRCYDVYAYKYTASGWTFVGTEQEYCTPA